MLGLVAPRWLQADNFPDGQIMLSLAGSSSASARPEHVPAQVVHLVPLYTAGLKLAQEHQEPSLEIAMLNNFGVLTGHPGDEPAAQRLYERAQAVLQSISEHENASLVLQHNLAKTLIDQGNVAEGASEQRQCFKRALWRRTSKVRLKPFVSLVSSSDAVIVRSERCVATTQR